jgi:4-deoxy-L-threo-5-hexosulose-uronate ketol-isomerase
MERLNTADLRESFLVRELFVPGEFRLVLTDADRIAVAGILPVEPIRLPRVESFGTGYFTERRELGVFTLAGSGVVTIDGDPVEVNAFDCLYVAAATNT